MRVISKKWFNKSYLLLHTCAICNLQLAVCLITLMVFLLRFAWFICSVAPFFSFFHQSTNFIRSIKYQSVHEITCLMLLHVCSALTMTEQRPRENIWWKTLKPQKKIDWIDSFNAINFLRDIPSKIFWNVCSKKYPFHDLTILLHRLLLMFLPKPNLKNYRTHFSSPFLPSFCHHST